MLFKEMFLLAATVIGGGYVILSVADRRFSKKFDWVRSGELLESLPLFQLVPGIIGGHVAIFLGNRVAGTCGAAVALVGMILPSVLIFLLVSVCYRFLPLDHQLMEGLFLGLRAALTGILLDMVVRTWRKAVTGFYGISVFALALAALLIGGVSPSRVIVAGMTLGLVWTFCHERLAAPSETASRVYRSFWAIPLLFLGYGLLAFGGGFVLVPVYLRDFVGEAAPYLQLASGDFANIMALTQMTPGPVAANCATFFGYCFGGAAGAFVATLCLILPGAIILWLALRSIERFRASVFVRGVFFGVRPVTTALLVNAGWAFAGMSVWQGTGDGVAVSPLAAVLAALTFVTVRREWLHPVLVIILAAAVGFACGWLLPGGAAAIPVGGSSQGLGQ